MTSVGKSYLWKNCGPRLCKPLFRNRRRRLEVAQSQPHDTNTIEMPIEGEPLPADVLLGGIGRGRRKHPGNELLHLLVQQHFDEYESLTRGHKMKVVDNIMDEIQNRGGRFVSQSSQKNGQWAQVPSVQVKERISKYFRNYRRPSRKTKK